MTPAFDKQAYIQELIATGIPAAHAEEEANALESALGLDAPARSGGQAFSDSGLGDDATPDHLESPAA